MRHRQAACPPKKNQGDQKDQSRGGGEVYRNLLASSPEVLSACHTPLTTHAVSIRVHLQAAVCIWGDHGHLLLLVEVVQLQRSIFS